MGEIIIKVPGDTKEVLDLTKDGKFDKELRKIDLLLKQIKQKKALEFIIKECRSFTKKF